MDGRCPFCWDRNISPVGQRAAGNLFPAASRVIMECGDCEKWYWADTGEGVPRLFEICLTSMVNPKRCIEDIREILSWDSGNLPRRRAAEFNQLCGACLNARFVPKRTLDHIQKSENRMLRRMLPGIQAAAHR